MTIYKSPRIYNCNEFVGENNEIYIEDNHTCEFCDGSDEE